MKALSVKAPWAYYLAAGLKDVENRIWKTDYRGPVAIHVSGNAIMGLPIFADPRLPLCSDYFKIIDAQTGDFRANESEYWYKDTEGFVTIKAAHSESPENIFFRWCASRCGENRPAVMPSHAIIGTVELYDIVRDSPSPWAEAGCYHWLIRGACFFGKPVLEIKGELGLWSYEGSLPA